MAYLFWPDGERLKEKGYVAIAHVPALFYSNWKYHDEVSRYLRERALLEWSPGHNGLARLTARRFPTDISLRTFGEALCNFTEWCEVRNLDWRKLEYVTHLVDGYQAEMLEGTWSASGIALKASTANQRTQEACNFLRWAAVRGLRPAFDVVTTTRQVSAPSARQVHGHRPLEVKSRVGAARQDPAELRIPTDAEIEAWLRSVRIERGPTKTLMCELVIATGIRREEVVQWRIDTLPEDRADWHTVGEHVEVVIRYGTKGQKQAGPGGERHGPPRRIAIPLKIAERLDHYREYVRPGQRASYVRAAKSRAEQRQRMRNAPKQLFLSDTTGQPISAKAFYDAWTEASKVPYSGWSPHPGRHYWACKTLLNAVLLRKQALGDATSHLSPALVSESATDTLNMVIRPQLGHVSVETSALYLVWVQRAFTLTDLHDAYEKSLEDLILDMELSNG
jgi:integrase